MLDAALSSTTHGPLRLPDSGRILSPDPLPVRTPLAATAAVASQPTTRLTPVSADERIHALDILRGLALFGMILVHFHQKMRLDATGLEDLIGWGVWVLVEQKAWGTFAFLFGVGFAVLLRRLEARGAPVTRIYLRRLGTLALFGIVAEVGFGFQILFEYAAWGLALLVVRRWSTRSLLACAVLAASVRPLVHALGVPSPWMAGARPALRQAVDLAAQQSHYAALLAARWNLFVADLPHVWTDLLPDSNLVLFIVGLLAVRYQVVDQPKRHVRLIVGWMLFALVSWALYWLVLRNLPTTGRPVLDQALSGGFGILQDQWLCFAYIGTVLLLLAYRPVWTARLAPFGQSGRMALTNYMLQAALLDVLASSYGFGLRLRPYVYAPAAVLCFAVVAMMSMAWLRSHRFGPLEWVWRTVTYAERQPLRRTGGKAVGSHPPRESP